MRLEYRRYYDTLGSMNTEIHTYTHMLKLTTQA